MTEETDRLHSDLVASQIEAKNLQEGYVVLNRRYIAILNSLGMLTETAVDAARRAGLRQTSLHSHQCAQRTQQVTRQQELPWG